MLIDGLAVMIDVDTNTDELVVSLGQPPMGEDWQAVTTLSENDGKRLGWCWIGRNYRGYLDSFTVAFNGINPTCMFVGIGSAIWIKKVATA